MTDVVQGYCLHKGGQIFDLFKYEMNDVFLL